jgi:hypothetical protein
VTLDVPGAAAVTLSGRVTAADTGAPLAATVDVAGGLSVATDGDGRYALRLPPGGYRVEARALGYLASAADVEIGAGGASADIRLEPDQPRAEAVLIPPDAAPGLAGPAWALLTLANTGTRELQYRVGVPAERYGVWRSDEPGGPAGGLLALPDDAPELDLRGRASATLPLGMAFPFYGQIYAEALVGADGVVAFSRPLAGGSAGPCAPDGTLYLQSIAAFRAALDLSAGGRVRHARLPDGGVVVSYEGVPAAGGGSYTFQVALRPDGRVELRYGDLGPLPARLGVGVQRSPADSQQLGCGATAPVRPGLAIELRPQPSSAVWLRVPAAAGSLAPGATRAIPIAIWWAPPGPWPLRGRVLVQSSDPRRPSLELPIDSRPEPAAAQVFFPRAAAP